MLSNLLSAKQCTNHGRISSPWTCQLVLCCFLWWKRGRHRPVVHRCFGHCFVVFEWKQKRQLHGARSQWCSWSCGVTNTLIDMLLLETLKQYTAVRDRFLWHHTSRETVIGLALFKQQMEWSQSKHQNLWRPKRIDAEKFWQKYV